MQQLSRERIAQLDDARIGDIHLNAGRDRRPRAPRQVAREDRVDGHAVADLFSRLRITAAGIRPESNELALGIHTEDVAPRKERRAPAWSRPSAIDIKRSSVIVRDV